MSDKYLWKFNWDCGRSGDLEGLFVTTEQEIQNIIGKEANFGEVLGKHSEIYGTIEEGEIVKVDLDAEIVTKVAMILGDTWSGYNPLEYVHYECNKCASSYLPDDLWDIDGERLCWNCKEEKE